MELNERPRVLIVDDDRQNLIVTAESLKHLGAEIDITTKAKEAIYWINSKNYALLIFDVQMPEMDGFQLAEIIQSGYRNSKTPIIFISGVYFDEFSIFKGYRKGGVDYMTKPLNMEILQSKVLIFLEMEKARRDLELEKAKSLKALEDKILAVGTVSHEIRNPLGVIASIADLMRDDIKDPELLTYLNILSSSTDHMTRLLNDLVDYSKIEMGQIELDRSHFNLKEELGLIIKSYELQNPAHKNNFFLNIENDIPLQLSGDITRYKQILYNLVGNANKFTKNGEVKLKVIIGNKSENHLLISTQVCDNGIGMSLEEQKDIFKPFSQSNQTITRRFGGSGLGLSISKRLSQIMGGDIELKSEKGIGSCFTFTTRFRLCK